LARPAGAGTHGGRLLAGVLAVTVTAAGWACWLGRHVQPHPVGVVIITLDTTRADRLPAYGYMDVSLPALDRLAAEGIVFGQATSVGALTLPAHASLFTGLLPPAHGVRENADPPLATDHVTLAEMLEDQGFRTAAFVGAVVLNADRGLAQGFGHYSDVGPRDGEPERKQRRADEVVDEATRWLEGVGDDRFFLWAHLYDPHRPYDPPPPFRSMPDPYMGEIAFADSQIGRLVEALERRALLDRTIVIVVGDHGESLGDHGERDHGIFVYESVLRVPFILRAPAVAPGRVGEVVRLTDVMPTVLDLLDIEAPPGDGVSLVELIHGRSTGLDLDVYAESVYPQRFGWSPLFALRRGPYKFIDAPRPELYDLDADPFEQRNVYALYPAVADALREDVREIQRRTAPAAEARMPVSAETRQALAALGYLGHSFALADRRGGQQLPDPKDCIGAHTAPMSPVGAPVSAATGCR
jgi:choline-sulfatase